MFAKIAIVVGAAALIAASGAAAQESKWMVRVRAIDIMPSASSGPVPGVNVDDKWAPEVDISYFLTKPAARVPAAGTHAERFGRGTTRLVSWPVLHEGGNV